MAAMYEQIAAAFLIALAVYAIAGMVFAIPFLMRGVVRIDDRAHSAGLGFRLIILPGVIALWPVLIRRWRHAHCAEEIR
jgi:hypothetical protein